jgi:hypothetical protein
MAAALRTDRGRGGAARIVHLLHQDGRLAPEPLRPDGWLRGHRSVRSVAPSFSREDLRQLALDGPSMVKRAMVIRRTLGLLEVT